MYSRPQSPRFTANLEAVIGHLFCLHVAVPKASLIPGPFHFPVSSLKETGCCRSRDSQILGSKKIKATGSGARLDNFHKDILR